MDNTITVWRLVSELFYSWRSWILFRERKSFLDFIAAGESAQATTSFRRPPSWCEIVFRAKRNSTHPAYGPTFDCCMQVEPPSPKTSVNTTQNYCCEIFGNTYKCIKNSDIYKLITNIAIAWEALIKKCMNCIWKKKFKRYVNAVVRLDSGHELEMIREN